MGEKQEEGVVKLKLEGDGLWHCVVARRGGERGGVLIGIGFQVFDFGMELVWGFSGVGSSGGGRRDVRRWSEVMDIARSTCACAQPCGISVVCVFLAWEQRNEEGRLASEKRGGERRRRKEEEARRCGARSMLASS